ncbi:MAG TPA: hypothetical protein VGU45_11850 [Microvirga sp.]|jgi:sarcosine oxidase delta subunit|nr:hypothetical protein [Microvirga sp.]
MSLAKSIGIRCPNCGNEDELFIRCYGNWTRITTVDDEDYDCEEVGGYEWGPECPASCDECNHEGTVASFSEGV